ncbi:hypothetical protein PVAND_017110 [Polypedilum vanderplanki]|uniref:AMP-binding enzyme C-terminal domain-containing protein n=1 Tax=Polypedilum vanderplanki TaxID=319348 RepID=A0A9J6BHN4_POLVA|nr:hypothetical protein PVAND_017110 [Polypedilum vanderplanki]
MLIICDEIVQNAVNLLKSDIKIITVMEDVENYDSVTKILNREAEKDFKYPEIDPNSIAVILVSSGTTEHLKIVDDDGNALDNFQQGEICVKHEVPFAGYIDEPERTKESYDGGWFKTGDIGCFDDEDFLFIIDRKKEIIKYQGIKTAPSELEAIIYEIDGVVSSCVVGIYQENTGNDIIHAFVIKKDSSDLNENFILNFVDSKVMEQRKIRGGVHFIDNFPLGRTGKIDKNILKMKAKEIMKKFIIKN